jgi:hypothetical protein
MIMEAHGNEYLAQLLDRAANFVSDSIENASHDADVSEREAWMREYHAEKARFGQPEGSPAYAETRGVEETENAGDTRTAKDAGAANKARREAPRAKKG